MPALTTSPRYIDQLRGLARLAVTATSGVTSVVEDVHAAIAGGPLVLGQPLARPVRALLPLIYGRVRGVAGVVGTSIDVVLASLDQLVGENAPSAEVDAVVSALNGVVGDYLESTGNPLAIAMGLVYRGRVLKLDDLAPELPAATDKALVLVHGSSMNDRQWHRGGHDHGAALARDLGYTPIYVRYNSGLHISVNGRVLSSLLEKLVLAWPGPLRELALLGHSMGGLVARSACHVGSSEGSRWMKALCRLACLGSPHHGAPLERGGNLVDLLLRVSHYSAPLARLGQIRSAGVTDLRYGNVVDEDWSRHERFGFPGDVRRPVELPADVACFAVAGSLSKVMARTLRSDGIVPVASALGRHARDDMTLKFPLEHQWVALGTGHVELLSSQSVYERLRGWF